jgi:hypothetical protein
MAIGTGVVRHEGETSGEVLAFSAMMAGLGLFNRDFRRSMTKRAMAVGVLAGYAIGWVAGLLVAAVIYGIQHPS